MTIKTIERLLGVTLVFGRDMKGTGRPSVKEIVTASAVHTSVLLILFWLSAHTRLHLPLAVSLSGAAFMGYLSLRYCGSLNRAKKVAFIGLTISFGILSVLFSIKYYYKDIKINRFLILGLFAAPVFGSQYLEKKAKERSSNKVG